MHLLLSDSITLQINALQDMQRQLTTTQSDVLMDLIHRQSGQIIFSGIGKSGHIAHKITSSIKSLGINATFLHASEAMQLLR